MTGYGLDGPGIKSRWGVRFSAPVQTGPGVHPASCTMDTMSFPAIKSGRHVTLTPHPLLVPWSRKSRAIPLLPPMGRTDCTEPQCLYKGALYLIYIYRNTTKVISTAEVASSVTRYVIFSCRMTWWMMCSHLLLLRKS